MPAAKIQEIREELAMVLSARGSGLIDSILPMLTFLVVNSFSGPYKALIPAVILTALLALFRLRRGQSLNYSLGGLGGIALASLFVILSGSERGLFFPGFISGSLIVGLNLASILLNRPLVAWTSFLTRRWPLDWYWHPRVKPAYNEVTLLWAAAFTARLALEIWLFGLNDFTGLALVKALSGWPFLITLLVGSYLYGGWRLRHLAGPSVGEFKQAKDPPWQSQQRGF
jgi:hypothetical protein